MSKKDDLGKLYHLAESKEHDQALAKYLENTSDLVARLVLLYGKIRVYFPACHKVALELEQSETVANIVVSQLHVTVFIRTSVHSAEVMLDTFEKEYWIDNMIPCVDVSVVCCPEIYSLSNHAARLLGIAYRKCVLATWRMVKKYRQYANHPSAKGIFAIFMGIFCIVLVFVSIGYPEYAIAVVALAFGLLVGRRVR